MTSYKVSYPPRVFDDSVSTVPWLERVWAAPGYDELCVSSFAKPESSVEDVDCGVPSSGLEGIPEFADKVPPVPSRPAWFDLEKAFP